MKMQLTTIGGLGAEKHDRTSGVFEVRYYDTRTFDNLYDAFIFYYNLEYPACLYDVTSFPVCLEMKVYEEFQRQINK